MVPTEQSGFWEFEVTDVSALVDERQGVVERGFGVYGVEMIPKRHDASSIGS